MKLWEGWVREKKSADKSRISRRTCSALFVIDTLYCKNTQPRSIGRVSEGRSSALRRDAPPKWSKRIRMKAVILAGGLGTRLSEETGTRPKPMVEIGGRPILWHILKIYSRHGINDFIICCGYKGYMIKEYFANYFLHMSDVTFDMQTNAMHVHQNSAEPWRGTLVHTRENSLTGGRVRRGGGGAKQNGGELLCLRR